jgi:hypothetical protein
MFTKPCLRAADGCQGLVKDSRHSRLAMRKFCSSWCSNRYQVERGIHPLQHKSLAQRRESGRKGGKRGAETRRKAAVQAMAERVKSLMPVALRAKLNEREQVVLHLLFVRAWEAGHLAGMSVERARRRRADAAKARGCKAPRRQLATDARLLEDVRRQEAA